MQPHPPVTNPQKEEKVIGYITFQYRGAAFALQKRAEQLNNTIYAVKQFIHTLRQVSQVSIDGDKNFSFFLHYALLTQPCLYLILLPSKTLPPRKTQPIYSVKTD